MIECDIVHRRSVAVLCLLYMIKFKPMHLVYGVLPVPCSTCAVLPVPVFFLLHVVLWSYIGILMRLLTAEPRNTARPLFPSQCRCDPVFDGVRLSGFNNKANAFLGA